MSTKPAKACDDRFVAIPVADRSQELVLERLHAVKDEVFLGRKVVEHGRLGNVRVARDLRDRYVLEPALREQTPRRFGRSLPGALLLALTKSKLSDS